MLLFQCLPRSFGRASGKSIDASFSLAVPRKSANWRKLPYPERPQQEGDQFIARRTASFDSLVHCQSCHGVLNLSHVPLMALQFVFYNTVTMTTS